MSISNDSISSQESLNYVSAEIYEAKSSYKKAPINSGISTQPVTPVMSTTSHSESDSSSDSYTQTSSMRSSKLNTANMNFYNPGIHASGGIGGTIDGGSSSNDPFNISIGMNMEVCQEYSARLNDSSIEFQSEYHSLHGDMEGMSNEWYGSAGDAFAQLIAAMDAKRTTLCNDIVKKDEALATACLGFQKTDEMLNIWKDIRG